MRSSDNESGGIERIDPITTSQKLGSKVANFANILLDSSDDEDASLSEVLVLNGAKAVKWLNSQGAISDTAAQSAFDKKGNLTAEAKLDLQNILKESLFQGGVSDLPAMFNRMPAKAQKTILGTFMRDFDSEEKDRILPEIQKAIEAWFDCASTNKDFSKASNYEQAKAIMRGWMLQPNMYDGRVPTDTFSNFAIELACRLQGCSMRESRQNMNDFFDFVQGKSQGDLFGEVKAGEKLSMQEAIRRVFGIEYEPINSKKNGTKRSNTMAPDGSQGEEGGPRGPANGSERERNEGGGEPPVGGGGTEGNNGEGTEVKGPQGPQPPKKPKQQKVQGLSDAEAEALINSMKAQANPIPDVKVNDETWQPAVATPLGVVKMGENQREKLIQKDREQQYGMLLATLSNPDIVRRTRKTMCVI
jgi:hypothetical protein